MGGFLLDSGKHVLGAMASQKPGVSVTFKKGAEKVASPLQLEKIIGWSRAKRNEQRKAVD